MFFLFFIDTRLSPGYLYPSGYLYPADYLLGEIHGYLLAICLPLPTEDYSVGSSISEYLLVMGSAGGEIILWVALSPNIIIYPVGFSVYLRGTAKNSAG